jgi:tRNA pseudouridine55 synthase
MALNGWIILDKPSGITSAHAVAKVKRLLRPDKIGHAGTLDPMASGLLPLALGEATKTVSYMMDGRKSYEFTVLWGQERDTDDIEGAVTATRDRRPTEAAIRAVLPAFMGKIQQVPPDYSAIKVDGKRSYDLARQGRSAELKSREVEVTGLEIANYTADNTSFICHCGKGTYIRSLARDMGRALGCLGTVSALRRTRVAGFTQADAISLEMLEKMIHKERLQTAQGAARGEGAVGDRIPRTTLDCFLRPVEAALDDILAWDIHPDQATSIKRGQSIPLTLAGVADQSVLLARCNGVAVAMCTVSQGSVKPARVFNV